MIHQVRDSVHAPTAPSAALGPAAWGSGRADQFRTDAVRTQALDLFQASTLFARQMGLPALQFGLLHLIKINEQFVAQRRQEALPPLDE